MEWFHSSRSGTASLSTRRKSTPSYLPCKQSGRARSVWTAALGIRQQKLLPGSFDSPESRTAFTKLQLELVSDSLPGCQATSVAVSVNEVLLAHLHHAGGALPSGESAGELGEGVKSSSHITRS